MNNLKELMLHNNELGSDSAASLAACLASNKSLTKLWLHNNQLDDAGKAAIKQTLQPLSQLAKIELGS